MSAILWPDIEAALVDYLAPLVAASSLPFADDVRVSNTLTDEPGDPRPDYAVTVRNDGGPMSETVFADVRLGINVWALEKHEAVDLAALVSAWINAMPEASGNPFVGASIGVAYEIPESSGQAHLYAPATARVRGINL